jgi:putrescine aminotransferase
MSTTPETQSADLIEETIESYQRHVNAGLASLLRFMGFDTVEVEARGMTVRTADGREYLDCLGGYGVYALGHAHPRVVAAVREQLDLLPMSSRTIFSPIPAQLAARLAEVTPGELCYSFICNSGAEAVEGALKLPQLRRRSDCVPRQDPGGAQRIGPRRVQAAFRAAGSRVQPRAVRRCRRR